MADIDNVTVGENNYNLRDTPARNAMPTQGQVDDIIEALDIIAAKSNTPYNASNKLPTDYADDTNQTHKFATQAQLTQIETNKTNILLSESLNPISVYSLDSKALTGASFIIPEDTAVKMPKGEYNLSFTSNSAISGTFVVNNGSTETHRASLTIANGSNSFNFTINSNSDKIRLYASASCEITNLSIVPKIYRDNGYTDYISQTLPNTELTALEKKNEDNIVSLTANGGGKNLLNTSSPVRLYNATYSNGIVTQVTDDTKSAFTFALQGYSAPTAFVKMLNQVITTENGRIRLSFTKDNTFSIIAIGHSGSSEDCKIFFDISNLANGDYYAQINLINYQQSQGKYQFNELMIYDTEYDMLYQPYALSNAELTTLEKQNETNISLNTSNGVKNVLCIERDVVYALNSSLSWNGNTCSYNGVDYTFENGVITVNTPTAATATSYIYLSQTVDKYCNGQYILSGHSGNVRIYAAKGNYFKEDDGNGVVLTTTSETGVGAIIRVDSGETVSNLVITPMIRPITTDSAFEKYAPSNRELYEMILAL